MMEVTWIILSFLGAMLAKPTPNTLILPVEYNGSHVCNLIFLGTTLASATAKTQVDSSTVF